MQNADCKVLNKVEGENGKMRKFCSLLMVFIISSSLTSCKSNFSKLNTEDIKDIKIWTHAGSRDLTESEISEFVRLYNASAYGGKATGEGGTPDFGISFKLIRYDKNLTVNDFNKKDKLEIVGNGQFYIINKELYEFIEKLSKEI